MKSIHILGLALAILLSGCDLKGENKEMVIGNGLRMSTTRPYSTAFEALSLKNSYDGTVELQKSAEVQIKADTNLLEYVQSSLSQGTLSVQNSKELLPTNDIEVTIRTQSLKQISLVYASEIRVLSINTDKFLATVADSSKLTLSGQVNELTLIVSGNSSVDASGLTAKKLVLTQSGSSVTQAYAQEVLEANLSNQAQATVFGNPPDVTQTVAQAASLRLTQP